MDSLASVITSLAALVAAIGTIWVNHRVKKIDKEVKTINSQTIAELADADETRRIDKIPAGKRTPLEKSHIKETKG